MNAAQSKAARLELLRQIARRREDEAVRRLGDSQRQLAEREAQMNELERYLSERSAQREGSTLGPALLSNRDAFLARLGDAIRHQSSVVSEARARADTARETWTAKHRVTDAYGHLVEQHARKEQKVQERKVQKELDEFVRRRREAGS